MELSGGAWTAAAAEQVGGTGTAAPLAVPAPAAALPGALAGLQAPRGSTLRRGGRRRGCGCGRTLGLWGAAGRGGTAKAGRPVGDEAAEN